MNNIIIWGAAGKAIMIEEIIYDYNLNISAVFDKNINISSPFKNIPIFYDEEKLHTLKKGYFTVAIGYNNNIDRYNISKKLYNYGFKPIKLISKNSIISNSSYIDEGVQIFTGAIIMPKAHIGEYSSISPSVTVSHEAIIEKGVFIGPGTTICGNVNIGEFTVVGAGATILPNIKIGKNVIIGAGSVVTKNVEDNKKIYGNPAK